MFFYILLKDSRSSLKVGQKFTIFVLILLLGSGKFLTKGELHNSVWLAQVDLILCTLGCDTQSYSA